MFRCDQNGTSARRSEPDWHMEGAYLNGYVTDEQRSCRPIFIATPWAASSWLFFRVARSTRMNQIWALRSRLEKQPTDRRRKPCYLWDRTLGASPHQNRPRKRGNAPRAYRTSLRNALMPFCTSRIMAAPEPRRSTPRSSLNAEADVKSTRQTRVASLPFTWIGHSWLNVTNA